MKRVRRTYYDLLRLYPWLCAGMKIKQKLIDIEKNTQQSVKHVYIFKTILKLKK